LEPLDDLTLHVKKLLQTTKECNCNNAFSHSKANEQKTRNKYYTKFCDNKTTIKNKKDKTGC